MRCGGGNQLAGEACGSHARRPDVGVGEIVTSAKQRLSGHVGQGIAIGIAEVEPGRMPAAAAIVPICLRRDAGLLGVGRSSLPSDPDLARHQERKKGLADHGQICRFSAPLLAQCTQIRKRLRRPGTQTAHVRHHDMQ
jgi:hypothetical protein